MQIAFKGTLSAQTKLPEIMERILVEKYPGLTAIRMYDPATESSGNIFISQGRFICGADLRVKPFDTRESIQAAGYDSLRILCNVATAEYQVVTGPHEYFEYADLSFNIPIETIVSMFPSLPPEHEILPEGPEVLEPVFSSTRAHLVVPPEPVPAVPGQSRAAAASDGWRTVKDIAINLPLMEDEEVPIKETRFLSLEERARDELPPDPRLKAKSKSGIEKLVVRIAKSINNFFINLFTAPVHLVKLLADRRLWLPLSIALIVLCVGNFVFSKLKMRAPNSAAVSAPPAVARKQPGATHLGRARSGGLHHGFDGQKPDVSQVKPVKLPSPDDYVLNPNSEPVRRRAYQAAP